MLPFIWVIAPHALLSRKGLEKQTGLGPQDGKAHKEERLGWGLHSDACAESRELTRMEGKSGAMLRAEGHTCGV